MKQPSLKHHNYILYLTFHKADLIHVETIDARVSDVASFASGFIM